MNRRNFIGLSAAAFSLHKAHGAELDEPPQLSFGLITDVQYADAAPEGERHYRESFPKLQVAVAWLAEKKLSFTLHLGDMIDRDFDSFHTILPLLEGLGHPVRQLLGNHDYDVADSEKARVVTTLGMPTDYYQFSRSGVRVVMLDTNDLSIYKYREGSPQDLESVAMLKKLAEAKLNNAKPWNGGISETQLKWLNSLLEAADNAKERVILCGHHPLLPEDGLQAWNGDAVLAVIDRHPCVVACFSGHHHAGAEIIRHGIPFITFKSVLHEPNLNSYSAIHLFSSKLKIEGNGREASRTIALRQV